MILDTQEQKEIILSLINSVQIPGNVLDKVYELKKAVETAEVK